MAESVVEGGQTGSGTDQWYFLATLYGTSSELDERNRVAWNRFMANELSEDDRAFLVKSKRCSIEELTPFSMDELRAVVEAFANRSGSGALPPVLGHEKRIVFQKNLKLKSWSMSRFVFPVRCVFSQMVVPVYNFEGAFFAAGVDFEGATFPDKIYFKNATFFTRGFANTSFEDAVFSGEADFQAASFSGGVNFEGAR